MHFEGVDLSRSLGIVREGHHICFRRLVGTKMNDNLSCDVLFVGS